MLEVEKQRLIYRRFVTSDRRRQDVSDHSYQAVSPCLPVGKPVSLLEQPFPSS